MRDLATILGQLGTGKDFWDGKDWQKDDFDGPIKWRDNKPKEKDLKREIKEVKEFKAEKIELDGVFDPLSQPDPRIEQVIRALSGLSAKVNHLADQIESLKNAKG